MKNFFTLVFFLCWLSFYGQNYFPNNEGVSHKSKNYTALIHAKIHVSPSKIIDNGTLLIKDGMVIKSAQNVTIPANSLVIDLKGKNIYPSFIDLYTNFGVDAPSPAKSNGRSAQYKPSRTGYYWNDHVMPEKTATASFNYDDKKATDFLKAGFGVLNTHIDDGIVRGTSALIALNNNADKSKQILDDKSAQYFSFKKSITSKQSYPASIMGSMALLRQLYLDANWYKTGNIKTTDLSLEAFNANQDLPQVFVTESRLNALRADKVGDENNVQYILVGGGDEYERIEDVKNTNATFIIPVNFPEAFDVEDPFLTDKLTLKQMRQWNQKPTNPKVLAENNVPFTFTTHGLKSPNEFLKNMRTAISYGLSKETALAALTTIPAKIIGKPDLIGNLQQGALANFFITSGEVFDADTIIYEHWIQGQPTRFENMDTPNLAGKYQFSIGGAPYDMVIKKTGEKLKPEITSNKQKRGAKISLNEDWIHLTITDKDTTAQNFIRIVAKPDVANNLNGTAMMPNGTTLTFYAKHLDDNRTTADKGTDKTKPHKIVPVTLPNSGYGFSELPRPETILFKNATVWTNESDGILKNTDVLVKDGKIAKIGSNLSYNKARIIDATGKHLTTGIIDEHSHIATSAVNEWGQNSSAEVSIEDVLNPSDISIYRNLAGGVTSIQVLHGSANPIGGRSAIIKLKWGESASNLIYENSPKFIKFALGENVKQSNWGDAQKIRFPQTRMGVEQVYMDYFTRAQEYDALKKSGKPYRKDIEMEVLAEILNKERFITCHSYVQSEINMLMKVANKFNFKINTFTHILEGYKVADKMVAHGVGGSTFSDWWAYKYEVNDAIPYNAAIMHKQGVTVAINSDDSEMSRRLNQEAAKTVKYGGVSEEDAWKFVTLNPAKLLHIDNRVGSIKVGKDADLVLWSGHPLSIYSKAEKTLIEGAIYFDIDRDKTLRQAINDERNQLINMMLQAKNKGMKTQPIKTESHQYFHCDTKSNNF